IRRSGAPERSESPPRERSERALAARLAEQELDALRLDEVGQAADALEAELAIERERARVRRVAGDEEPRPPRENARGDVLHERAAHALARGLGAHGEQRDEPAQEKAVLHDDEAERGRAARRPAREPDLALLRHAAEVAPERRGRVAEAAPGLDPDDPARLR